MTAQANTSKLNLRRREIDMPTADQLSKSILELTHTLKEKASVDTLDEFLALQQQRDALVQTLELGEHEMVNPDQVRKDLQEAHRVNAELMSTFSAAQGKLLDEKSALNRGSKMREAYDQNR